MLDATFYVYIYLDPRKKGPFTYGEYTFEYQPFYVGKGKRGQWLTHLVEARRKFLDDVGLTVKQKILIEIIKVDKIEPVIIKYKENISERESFDLEIDLITSIGRLNLNNGPLSNLTNGGDGQSGRKCGEWTRRKMSRSQMGSKNAFYGKHHSESSKNKIRQKMRKINKITLQSIFGV